jgi:16S rRNA (uracil1498-N3)-methyltransferase
MSTLRRLFSIEPLTETGAVIRLDPGESHHGRHVLRFGAGDRVVVFDGAGRQFAATVERFENKRLVVALAEPVRAAPEAPVPIALYLSLVKGETFDNVLQRAVELGAAKIVPFIAARSVPTVGRGAALERKIKRWQQILLSAAKQCGRACLTAITPPVPFADAVRQADERAVRFCCVPDPAAPEMSKMLIVLKPSLAQSLALMIGPEGGLTPDEIAAARQSDWHLVSLGPRTLRVETAATAALTLILAALEEM